MLDGIQRQQTNTLSGARTAASAPRSNAKVQARGMADQGFLAQERALSPDGAAGANGGEPASKDEVVVTSGPLELCARAGVGTFTLGAGSRLRIVGEPTDMVDSPRVEMAPVVIDGLIRVEDGGSVWFADIRDNHVKDHTLTRDHFDTKVKGATCTFLTGTQFDPAYTWPTGKADNGRPQSKRCITKGRVFAPMSPLLEWCISGRDLDLLRRANAPK